MSETLIYAEREKDQVFLWVNGSPIWKDPKPYFKFHFQCGSEWSAELLKNQINKLINDSVRRLADDCYNKGWKEAKAKTKKFGTYERWLYRKD